MVPPTDFPDQIITANSTQEGSNDLLIGNVGDLSLLSAKPLDVVTKRLVSFLLDPSEVEVVARSVASCLETFYEFPVEVSP